MYELSKKEKINVLETLINSIKNTTYTVEQQLNAELQIENPSSNVIDGYNQQLLDLYKKINYLEEQVELLNNE